MEVAYSSKTYKTTQCHNPENHNLHFLDCENSKFHIY
jgi:hypothetical protein